MPQSRIGFTRRKSDVDVVPTRLAPVGQGLIVNEGIQILASSANTDTLYVGYSASMTANSADLTDGFPLVAGSAIFLPCRQASDIYIMSTSNPSQVIWFLGQ